MTADPATADSGALASLRALGASLLEALGTRAELAVVELREQAERRKDMLVLALAAGAFFAMALLMASLFVVALFWDTHRLAAIAAVGLFYLAGGLVAAWALRARAQQAAPPFQATLAQLERDREMLGGGS